MSRRTQLLALLIAVAALATGLHTGVSANCVYECKKVKAWFVAEHDADDCYVVQEEVCWDSGSSWLWVLPPTESPKVCQVSGGNTPRIKCVDVCSDPCPASGKSEMTPPAGLDFNDLPMNCVAAQNWSKRTCQTAGGGH